MAAMGNTRGLSQRQKITDGAHKGDSLGQYRMFEGVAINAEGSAGAPPYSMTTPKPSNKYMNIGVNLAFGKRQIILNLKCPIQKKWQTF